MQARLRGTGESTLNKLITGYARHGDLTSAMQILLANAHDHQHHHPQQQQQQQQSPTPDRNTFLALLALCSDKSALTEGRTLHTLISNSEYRSDDLLQNATINMFGKCGSVEEARSVFHSMQNVTQVSWNSLLAAYARSGDFPQAFRTFQRIQLHGFVPDRVTFVTIITACSNAAQASPGKLLHGYVVECGLESNVYVGTALMTLYGKLGYVDHARGVFEKLESQDVVSWTSMILTYMQHDQCVEGLRLFHRMRTSGVSPNRITYAAAVSACANLESLKEGELVHALTVEDGLDSDVVVSCAVVNMYGKCGSVERAREVFEKMHHPKTVSWNAVVAVYTQNGDSDEALVMFQRMQLEGLKPDKIAFVTILTACANASCLVEARKIHSQLFEAGLENDETVAIALLNAYTKCNSLENTCTTFERMGMSSVNACTRMIAAYIQHGLNGRAIEMFERMQLEGIIPDKITFITVFSACSTPSTLLLGQRLHACVLERGYQSDVVVSNCIITMYSECGRIDEAAAFFSSMAERDHISWNTIIGGHAQAGSCKEAVKLFREMLAEGVPTDKYTFIGLIDGVEGQRQAKFVGELLTESGVELDGFLVSAFLNVHSKYGNLEEARLLFDRMQDKDVVLWTSLLTAYVQHGSCTDALHAFREMRHDGVPGNEFTLTTVLNACAGSGDLSEGRLVHAHAVESGLTNSVLVGNGVVNMYAKCGCLEEARKSFHESLSKNLVSWNSMIAAYVLNERPKEALQVYQMMLLQGMKADRVTFVTVLNGCPGLVEAQRIHNMVKETGWESDHVVRTALLNAFAECLEAVTGIFSSMKFRDVISWNSVIAANVERGFCKDAIKLFKEMQLEGVAPDKISFITILNAFAGTSEFKEAKVVERQIVERGFLSGDVTVGNALVSMYGRSGRLVDARRVFGRMKQRDLYSWNGIVTAHANHGESEEALKLFRKMQQDSVKPDNITLTSVLSACSHVGLIDEGYYYFTAMEREYGVSTGEEHFGCIVDLLARSGRLDQAEEFIMKMPVDGGYVMWMTLLSACKMHGAEEIGKRASGRVMELDPRKPAGYILSSSI